MRTIAGQPVLNGARPIRLKVTDGDIAKGTRKNPDACAIALAACRRIKGVKHAKAHFTHVYLQFALDGPWYRYRTAPSARTEMIAYDRGGKFYPGEFDLLPVPVRVAIKQARQRMGASTPRAKRRGPKRPRYFVPGVREHAYKDHQD